MKSDMSNEIRQKRETRVRSLKENERFWKRSAEAKMSGVINANFFLLGQTKLLMR